MLSRETPRLLPSMPPLHKESSVFEAGDPFAKYDVINEMGSARNLSKLNLANSIYDEGDPQEVQYLLYLL